MIQRLVYWATRYILLTLLFGWVNYQSALMQDPLSTPPASQAGIFLQSGDNKGLVSPVSIQQVMDSTGISFFRKANRDGFGIRIGVLDAAFGGLDVFEAEAREDVSIPGEFSKSAYSNNLLTHGTDVLEVINTIAQGAKLYACQYDRFETFSRCIDYMLNQGVAIINHSAGVPILPLDGTNTWALEVEKAIANNVLWVNSAGNFANGFLQDQFTDSSGNSYHEFRGLGSRIGEEIRFRNNDVYNGNIILSWQDTASSPIDNIDLDLEIIDLNTGDILAKSEVRQTDQDAGASSYEVIFLSTSTNFGVKIKYVSGTISAPVNVVIFVEFARIEGAFTQGSVIAPADNPNVLTVGALQGQDIAPYSSRGILRNDAFLPDIIAPGEILLRDGRAFVGTSAAAPVVAGAAALIMEANPQLNAQGVMDYLSSTGILDAGSPGRDVTYGDGLLHLPDISVGGAIPTVAVRCSLQVFANTKIRSGPGTNFEQVGTLDANSTVTISGIANGQDGFEWFFFGNGQWARANTGDRIGNCSDLPLLNESGTVISDEPVVCPGAPEQILGLGTRARQQLAQDPIRVQNEPGGGTTLYLLYPDEIVSVNGGPRCHVLGDQPATWWLISSQRGPDGWVAEGTSTRYFWEVVGE